MPAIFASHHFFMAIFLFLVFFFPQTLFADPISSFSFTGFENDPQFESNMALYGNAKVVNGGSAIRLSGTGGVMYKKPIQLVEGKLRQLVSFSTYFVFSMSLEKEDGLAFVMAFNNSNNSLSGVPSGLRNGSFPVVAVEVSTSRDGKGGEGGSVIANINNTISSVKMGLESGKKVKLHAWIDYEASSKRLEVRLNQYGNSRPSDPLLWHSILLSNMKEKEEMLVGFSTVKENASEACFLYSWSFRSRQFPHWIHSEPLDPNGIGKNTEENLRVNPKCDCFHGVVVAAMVFGAGFGALIAIIALYFSTVFGNKEPVVPEECVVDFEYKKVNIVVDKHITEGGIKK